MNCHRFLHETQFYCLILRICYPCEIIIKEVLHVDFTLKKRKRKRFWKQPNRVLRIFTRSFETAIIIEAFGAILSKHIYGDVKHLVVLVVLCGSVLTHLWVLNKKKKKPNKEDVYMLVKKNKKQTKVGNGFLFLMSKIQMESQIWTRKSS